MTVEERVSEMVNDHSLGLTLPEAEGYIVEVVKEAVAAALKNWRVKVALLANGSICIHGMDSPEVAEWCRKHGQLLKVSVESPTQEDLDRAKTKEQVAELDALMAVGTA